MADHYKIDKITSIMIWLSKILSMADSIILAAAKIYEAILWTQDSDFNNIEGVKYFPRLYIFENNQLKVGGCRS